MSKVNNGDMPATPTPYMDMVNMSGELHCDNTGLTKLEHFTALAIQGICVNAGRNGLELHKPKGIADKAIEIAKLALDQLEQDK
jgi:hypothetical protein